MPRLSILTAAIPGSRLSVVGIAFILSAGIAQAHVVMSPPQSKLGKEETYTLTVPTEGKSATVSVELEVPAKVTILSVKAPAADYVLDRENGRISRVTWHVSIPPGGGRELTFVARNPRGPAFGIRWNVHQLFADGTRADWNEPPPAKPAPSTRLYAN